MTRFAAACAMVAGAAAASACAEESALGRRAGGPSPELTGRLLLPPGEGSRGVEVVVTVADADGEPRRVWLLFDEEGRFTHALDGRLTSVTVSTGLRAELHRIDAAALPSADATGRIDIGEVDLRERLTRHRLLLRAAQGAAPGEVRVALCFGPPPVGPYGERVELGSRQFPPAPLGSDVEWLLPSPPDARAIHFLVERPDPAGTWRGGPQQAFGPYDPGALPAELAVE